MENIFNLDDYKNHLASVYGWECDKDSYDQRYDYISRKYSDEYLSSIINKTQEFICFLIEKMNQERKILDSEIYDEIEFYEHDSFNICNGCHGGWPCDALFSINKEQPLISLHLVETYFGEKFRVWLSWNDYEDTNNEEESGLEYGFETFRISGPVELFDKIYNGKYLIRKRG